MFLSKEQPMVLENNKKKSYDIRLATDCMPKSKASQRILRKRALLISKEVIQEKQTDETHSYIYFYLGDTEKYAIDYQYTKEVLNNIGITKCPFVPSFVAGIINRRGALLTILDLKQMLFNQPSIYRNEVNIIIVQSENITLGILVDQIIGNKNYNRITLDPTFPSENIVKMEYILGLHEGKVGLLNIPAILTTASQGGDHS
jgi:purine-binding chemotaxis protein CheW